MALYYKWGDKNAFTFALQFFMLNSDSLGGVGGKYLVDNSDIYPNNIIAFLVFLHF